jgi:hypothetical protein
VTFIVGKEDAGQNMQALATQARDAVPMGGFEPPDQSTSLQYWTFAGVAGAVTVALAGLALFVRRRPFR